MVSRDETRDNVAAWEAAARWQRSEHMSEVEAALWRSERHPQASATVCSLLIYDRAPDWTRFREAHEWATRLVGRTRQRVLEPAVPTTVPTWVPDEHFRLDYHLRRRVVTRGMEEVLELCQQQAMDPFDRTRPLWEATLITGLEDARAAYFLKLHHALADGPGGVELLSLVTSRTREHTDDKPVAAPLETRQADPVALATAGVLHAAARTPAALAEGARVGLRALADPGTALSGAMRYGASLRRVLAPRPAPPSPLFAGRDGRSWNFRTLECPVADLKAAGRRGGGSSVDAFVAALLGGLRRYHELHDTPIGELPVSLPVSLSRADDAMGGGKFAGGLVALPVGVADPEDRIAAIRGEVFSLRTEPALEAVRLLAPVANRLPSQLGALAVQLGSAADLAVATVPGVSHPVYMAGARVERMYPFGPLPGVALMAAMGSHDGTACLGLTIDGAAVPDVDVLARCCAEGLDEVLALAR